MLVIEPRTPKHVLDAARGKMRARNEADRHDELTYIAYSDALELHKIGHTTSIRTRLSVLRSGCPDVRIIARYPYDRELERYLKFTYDHVRVPGTEWFWIPLGLLSIEKAVRRFENEKVSHAS